MTFPWLREQALRPRRRTDIRPLEGAAAKAAWGPPREKVIANLQGVIGLASVEEKLQLVISRLVQHYKVDKCALSIMTPEGLRLLVSHGLPSECVDTLHRTFAKQCMQRKLPTIIYNAAADPRFKGNCLVERADAARFIAGVPLACRRDLFVGSLCIFDSAPRHGCTLMDCEFLELEAMSVLDILSEAVAALLPGASLGSLPTMDSLPEFEESEKLPCREPVTAVKSCRAELEHVLPAQTSRAV